MTLDRWIAFFILLAFMLYGYTAFFMMDDLLPPIMRRNPVWPSSFPKVIAVGGTVVALILVTGIGKPPRPATTEIDFRHLTGTGIGRAALLIGLMAAYAFLLRPIGFLLATALFLAAGSLGLGERRYGLVALVAVLAAGGVWYLVTGLLGIYLNPLPVFPA